MFFLQRQKVDRGKLNKEEEDDDDDEDYGQAFKLPGMNKNSQPSKYLKCFNDAQQPAEAFPYEIQFSFELPCRQDAPPDQLIVWLVWCHASASL